MQREFQTSTVRANSAITKVFAWMALALFITFATAIGFTFLLNVMDPSLYFGIMIGASILQFILILVINFTGLLSKKQGVVKVPFILYALCMGVLMSSIIAFTEVITIIYAFGATFLCFGTMALIGWFSKTNMNVMSFIAMGLGIGALILSLVNIFMGSDTIGWVVSFAMFAFILLITAVDIYRIKQTSELGMMTENLAIFFAFQIYYDFIYIFIRILAFIASRRD